MSSTVRRSLATSAGALTLTGGLLLGLGGTALAEPAATAPASTPTVSLVSTSTVLADRDHDWGRDHRRCYREFHRASWYWSNDRRWDHGRWWEHRNRHFRPGWWSWSCR